MAGELATIPKGEYALSTMAVDELKSIVADNLGANDAFSEGDLARFKVPSGDSPAFGLTRQDGTKDAVKVIRGVVVAHLPRRRYYEKPASEQNGVPPDCQSPDGIRGEGTIARQHGGQCEACPMAQFGTSRGKDGQPGRGQACQQRRALFIVSTGEILPTILELPPTSLGTWKTYLASLISARLSISAVETEITIKTERSKGGQEYAECQFKIARKLDPADAASMREFGAIFAKTFTRRPVSTPTPAAVTVNGAPAGAREVVDTQAAASKPAETKPRVEPPGWATGAPAAKTTETKPADAKPAG